MFAARTRRRTRPRPGRACPAPGTRTPRCAPATGDPAPTLERPDELPADDLPLLLRVGDPVQRGQELGARPPRAGSPRSRRRSRPRPAPPRPSAAARGRRNAGQLVAEARWTSAAATAESTPPDSPQIARPADLVPDPPRLLLDDVQHRPRGRHPASSRNRRGSAADRCASPRGGIGRRTGRAAGPRPPPRASAECAVTVNPGGGRRRVAVGHPDRNRGRARPAAPRRLRPPSAAGYPRTGRPVRSPFRQATDQDLEAVADAEHRHPRAEQLGGGRGRPARTRGGPPEKITPSAAGPGSRATGVVSARSPSRPSPPGPGGR